MPFFLSPGSFSRRFTGARAEANFDERLGVYLHELVADIATPGEDSRTAPGQLGEPQFELPLSGWYWQITRLDVPKPEIRSSRSLFAAKLPRLSDFGVAAGAGRRPARLCERAG